MIIYHQQFIVVLEIKSKINVNIIQKLRLKSFIKIKKMIILELYILIYRKVKGSLFVSQITLYKQRYGSEPSIMILN